MNSDCKILGRTCGQKSSNHSAKLKFEYTEQSLLFRHGLFRSAYFLFKEISILWILNYPALIFQEYNFSLFLVRSAKKIQRNGLTDISNKLASNMLLTATTSNNSGIKTF